MGKSCTLQWWIDEIFLDFDGTSSFELLAPQMLPVVVPCPIDAPNVLGGGALKTIRVLERREWIVNTLLWRDRGVDASSSCVVSRLFLCSIQYYQSDHSPNQKIASSRPQPG